MQQIRPPLQPPDDVTRASRYLHRSIKGATGREVREKARASSNPTIRAAAATLDAWDRKVEAYGPIYRPMSIAESNDKRNGLQAGGTETPSGSATDAENPASPALPVPIESFGVRYFDQQLRALVAKVRAAIPDA